MSEPALKIERSVSPELVAGLARLWPHREHESGSLRGLLCALGLHRWRQLDLSQLHPGRVVRYCFWCPKIKVDGVVYLP